MGHSIAACANASGSEFERLVARVDMPRI